MIIPVRMTRAENISYYGVKLGDVVSLDLEDYLCGVVPSEVYESRTPMEALKAQAICARTYAMRKVLDGVIIDDTSNYQAYRATLTNIKLSPRSIKAVCDTDGLVLMYDGEVIQCYYSNSNGGETKRTEQVWSKALPYYANRPDLWDIAARAGTNIKASHGVGLSQVGAEYAASQGEDCNCILAFYYPGTVIARYEEGESMKVYPIRVDMHTQNDCYKAARVRDKSYITVHSVGVKGTRYPRWKQWDKPNFKKCAHAIIDDTEEWGIVQTLPWTYQGWLNGVTAGNDRSIAFEICEPSKDTEENAADLYGKTLYLCYYLCMEFGIPPENVICHAEAYKMGLANNHADVNHWWGKKGTVWEQYTMDRLRKDVADALGYVEDFPYQAEVVTNISPLNLWNVATTNTAQRKSLATAPKGSIVTVLGRASLSGWFIVQYGDVIGNSDGRYLRRIDPVVDEDVDEDLTGSGELPVVSVVVPGLDEAERRLLLDQYPGAYEMEVNG